MIQLQGTASPPVPLIEDFNLRGKSKFFLVRLHS